MPFNGSGTYNPIGTPDFPAVPGTTIRSAQYNNQIQDMATALSLCLTHDGQSVPTVNLPMGGFKLTGLGAPANPGDSLRQAQLRKGADIPSSATITIPVEGSLFDITGVVGISAINNTFPGRMVLLHFTDTLTLTHSTNLQLPGGVNITTLSGDFAIFLCLDSVKWVCYMYQRKLSLGGLPVIPLADIPTTDIGQISVVGVGTMEWDGSVYVELAQDPPAADVSYDNTVSGLTAVDVQDALDELSSPNNIGTKKAVNAVGPAPIFAPRAWIAFNGVGGIMGSGNVSSFDRLGAGVYKVNFAIALPDTNYSVVITGVSSVPTAAVTATTRLAASIGISTYNVTGVSNDCPDCNVTIFR